MTTAFVDRNAGFRSFHISELKQNGGSYVPNVKDLVVATNPDIIYKVESVNYDTGIAVLALFELQDAQDILGITNYYVSSGPFDIDDSRRVYIDYSLTPPVARIDATLRIPGSDARYIILFKGEDATAEVGVKVSLYYSADNTTPESKVPLVLSTPAIDANNPAIKVSDIFYVTEDMAHGSIATAVIYDEDDNALETVRLVVHRSDDVRRDNTLARYIVGIELLSPFARTDNPRVIEVPINATLADVPMMGLVRYSDGSTVELPLGGSKFTLEGTENYISSTLGAKVGIQLVYHLDKTERFINNNGSVTGQRSEQYILLSVRGNALDDAASDAYAAKLYGYPRWNPTTQVYSMEYFITMNDGVFYRVTSLVRPTTTGPQFNGANLGITQTFTVIINLNSINASFKTYNHVQIMSVNLARRGDETMVPHWTVAYQDSELRYGETLAVRGAALNEAKTSWSCYYVQPGTSKADFLQRSYYRSKPLYNPAVQEGPEEPTHMIISRFSGTPSIEVSLATGYGNPIALEGTFTPGELMIIKFIKRGLNGDAVLSVCGFPFIII